MIILEAGDKAHRSANDEAMFLPDVERLHEAGWDDEAILDAASGRRIARDGYLNS